MTSVNHRMNRFHLFSISGFVKRTLTLIVVVSACLVGFLSIRGSLPFLPVFGISMEPVLHAGDLIVMRDIDPNNIEVGDIIVFDVPKPVRELYNYPPVVAHRIISVRTDPGLTFRTKGDNTGEDPFTVRPQDVRGQVSKQIKYLGFPMLFFQSREGLLFVVIALALLALYLYSDELGRGRVFIHRSIFSPVIQASRQNTRELERRIESSEQSVTDTQKALSSFAEAIAEYAEHLKSHTSAIQGLSEASHELKHGAAEQNKVLALLLETLQKQQPGAAESGPDAEEKPEHIVPAVKSTDENTAEKVKYFPPGCFKSGEQQSSQEEEEVFDAG